MNSLPLLGVRVGDAEYPGVVTSFQQDPIPTIYDSVLEAACATRREFQPGPLVRLTIEVTVPASELAKIKEAPCNP